MLKELKGKSELNSNIMPELSTYLCIMWNSQVGVLEFSNLRNITQIFSSGDLNGFSILITRSINYFFLLFLAL